jgi:hypothetical protein
VLAELAAGMAATGYRTLQSLEREETVDVEAIADLRSREELVAALDDMTAAVRRALIEIPDGELELPVDHLGRRWSVRGILLLLQGQLHEQLGRLAGMAESGGVDPPWVRLRKIERAHPD